jgi:hypothetical protein
MADQRARAKAALIDLLRDDGEEEAPLRLPAALGGSPRGICCSAVRRAAREAALRARRAARRARREAAAAAEWRTAAGAVAPAEDRPAAAEEGECGVCGACARTRPLSEFGSPAEGRERRCMACLASPPLARALLL